MRSMRIVYTHGHTLVTKTRHASISLYLFISHNYKQAAVVSQPLRRLRMSSPRSRDGLSEDPFFLLLVVAGFSRRRQRRRRKIGVLSKNGLLRKVILN